MFGELCGWSGMGPKRRNGDALADERAAKKAKSKARAGTGSTGGGGELVLDTGNGSLVKQAAPDGLCVRTMNDRYRDGGTPAELWRLRSDGLDLSIVTT